MRTSKKKFKGLVQNEDGPLEPWFDKTWRPSDFELVE
jgi:hypothetical protein